MFGTNEIVGKSHFLGVPKDTLIVSSIFTSLQGEGPFAGIPAAFVRLTKCNLNCHFCDTYFDTGQKMTFTEILQQIDEAIEQKAAKWVMVVITGGEPLLQKNLSGFTRYMREHFETIQIETNGVLPIPEAMIGHIVVSPKCREQGGKPVEYLKPNPQTLNQAQNLKFLIEADPDSPYHTIPDWAFKWRDKWAVCRYNDVYISPINRYRSVPDAIARLRPDSDISERNKAETVSFWTEGLLDQEQNRRNHEYAAQYCMKHGLRLSLQQHLYASIP